MPLHIEPPTALHYFRGKAPADPKAGPMPSPWAPGPLFTLLFSHQKYTGISWHPWAQGPAAL